MRRKSFGFTPSESPRVVNAGLEPSRRALRLALLHFTFCAAFMSSALTCLLIRGHDTRRQRSESCLADRDTDKRPDSCFAACSKILDGTGLLCSRPSMTSLNKVVSDTLHFLRLHVAAGGHGGVTVDAVGKIVGVNMSAAVESACDVPVAVMGCTTPLRTSASHFETICLRVIL